MSIERPGKKCIPTCDICGGELPEEYDFYVAVSAKKRAGWRSRKDGSVWQDICCGCQKEDEHALYSNK